MKVGSKFNQDQVKGILPHRDPFLFIDRVLDILPGPNEHLTGLEAVIGRTVIAERMVTGKEDFFKGHFPGNPVMPGVIQLEIMAQASALLTYDPDIHGKNLGVLLVAVNDSRFRKPVVPGQKLEVRASLKSVRRNFYQFEAQCLVDGQKVSEATFTASFTSGGA